MVNRKGVGFVFNRKGRKGRREEGVMVNRKGRKF